MAKKGYRSAHFGWLDAYIDEDIATFAHEGKDMTFQEWIWELVYSYMLQKYPAVESEFEAAQKKIDERVEGRGQPRIWLVELP